MQKLGEYCRFNNFAAERSSDSRCLIGRRLARYEFYAHARLARKAKISAEIVEAQDLGHAALLVRSARFRHRIASTRAPKPTSAPSMLAKSVVDLVGVRLHAGVDDAQFRDAAAPGEPEPLA